MEERTVEKRGRQGGRAAYLYLFILSIGAARDEKE